jgi:hypothetical protein
VDTLRKLAGRLDEAAATVTAVAHQVEAAGPPHPAFGADGPGWPGELGRALHEQWLAATGARAREAAATAARLADVATAVHVAATGYAETDHAARHRHAEGG